MSIKQTILAAIAALALAVVVPASASAAELKVPFETEALLAFGAAEILTPTTVSGANNNCKPSAAHPFPVVLVHGTLEDEGSNWVTLAPLLANNGYCVYAFNYGETSPSLGGRIDGLGHIEKSAEELGTFVNTVLTKTGASKVDLVGHSQGGMMPNYYLKFLNGGSKVNELIGLAPSNHGTTLDGLTNLLKGLPAGLLNSKFLEAPSLEEQEEGSAFNKKLFGAGEPVVAGVKYVVIESEHDEVVTPYTNAFLNSPGVVNIKIQTQCPEDKTEHIGMNWDWPSLQNVLNELGASPNPSFKAVCTKFGSEI